MVENVTFIYEKLSWQPNFGGKKQKKQKKTLKKTPQDIL